MSEQGHSSRSRPPRQQSAPAADRLPPYSGEAEAAFLGCAVLDSLTVMNLAEERGVERAWFYDLRHQTVWEALSELHRKGTPADMLTVSHWLRERNLLEAAGGMEYLRTVPEQTPSAANAEYYLAILREQYLLRQVLRTGQELVSGVYSVEDGEKTDAEGLVARAERSVLRLAQERVEGSEASIQPLTFEVLAELEDYHRGAPQLRGLTTGLAYVDKMLCGLGGRNGYYTVLSARPGIGKTSLAMQIAAHVARDHVWFEVVKNADGQPVMERSEDGQMDRIKVTSHRGLPVAIFTLEMEKHALVHRMLFQRAEADMQRWRTGYAEGADLPRLTKAAGELSQADNIKIDDVGRTTIDTLKAKARRMHRQHGIKLFVIDYIQLLRSGGKRFREDRVQELSEISGDIFALGKELQAPFIVLAQMNRDYEKEPNREPRLSDLKDCGSIEQDADQVGFLYRPKLKDKKKEAWEEALYAAYGNDWSKAPIRVDLLWAKNRYGPTGRCELVFQKSSTKFFDYGEWLNARGTAPAAPDPGPLPTDEELGLD